MSRKVIQVNKNPVYDFGMIATVFGKDTEFSGDLTFRDSLQINGAFDGEINSAGSLVVAEGSTVKANIKAKVVIVRGTVYGNVEASGRLEIAAGGKLFGNIRTAKLKIADGVVFEGKCEMIKNAEKKGKKDSAQEEQSKE